MPTELRGLCSTASTAWATGAVTWASQILVVAVRIRRLAVMGSNVVLQRYS